MTRRKVKVLSKQNLVYKLEGVIEGKHVVRIPWDTHRAADD